LYDHSLTEARVRPQEEKELSDLRNPGVENLDLMSISPTKTRRLIRVLTTVAGCLSLIVPILLLYFLNSDVAKLVIVICSLIAFSTTTAAFTAAKNWEVVAASVA